MVWVVFFSSGQSQTHFPAGVFAKVPQKAFMTPTSNLELFRILAGLVAWFAILVGHALGWLQLGLIDVLLAFGLAFVVPLNLDRLRSSGLGIPGPLLIAGSAAAAIGSFTLDPGLVAAALTLPWLLLCLWIGLKGLIRFCSARSIHASHLLPAACVAYLVVGASWLAISRLGARPLGLSDQIIELTAVHFHFAGFAAILIALAIGELLAARSSRRAALALTAGTGVMIAMPVVAIGFFTPQIVVALGAVLLAVSLWVLAALMLPAAANLKGASRVLMTIAALSVIGPMLLAVHYAAGPLIGLEALSIPEMARFHGIANAFGFSACATLAVSPGVLQTAHSGK